MQVLRWIRFSGYDLFLTPPNATGSLCMLDQIFQDLHSTYDTLVNDLKHDNGPDMKINIGTAIQIFCRAWNKPWCSVKQRQRGYKVIGLFEVSQTHCSAIKLYIVPFKLAITIACRIAYRWILSPVNSSL
jgi:hypothetical protein